MSNAAVKAIWSDVWTELAKEHARGRKALALSAPASIERVALALTKDWPAEWRREVMALVTDGHPYLKSVERMLAK